MKLINLQISVSKFIVIYMKIYLEIKNWCRYYHFRTELFAVHVV